MAKTAIFAIVAVAFYLYYISFFSHAVEYYGELQDEETHKSILANLDIYCNPVTGTFQEATYRFEV